MYEQYVTKNLAYMIIRFITVIICDTLRCKALWLSAFKRCVQKTKPRNTIYNSLIHSRPWDDSALLQRQACTAPFHASEELSPSIRCPTRPVRFPLPLFAAVRPLGVVFCWLSLEARVWLCLTIQELRLCKREREHWWVTGLQQKVFWPGPSTHYQGQFCMPPTHW